MEFYAFSSVLSEKYTQNKNTLHFYSVLYISPSTQFKDI